MIPKIYHALTISKIFNALNLITLDYTLIHSMTRKLPDNFKYIYQFLLDFYSVTELESLREEFGDHILLQIYNDELAYCYR